ncbi:hypothetical protein HanLR1_Chr17g0668701 [Helianthus annuus]|nr:hypothetical protein HanHA89_Chr17g0710131 [Helianthus annuus]KAJ0632758.1 hypothetical protein HanLR1_Chr17g0668701 [Helianthus annuus]
MGGSATIYWIQCASTVSPSFMPKKTIILDVGPRILGFQMEWDFSNIQKTGVILCDHVHVDNILKNGGVYTRVQTSQIESCEIFNNEKGLNELVDQCSYNTNCKGPLLINPIGPLHLSNAGLSRPCKLSVEQQQYTNNVIEHFHGGPTMPISPTTKCNKKTDGFIGLATLIKIIKSVDYDATQIQFDTIHVLVCDQNVTSKGAKKWNKKRSDVSFDPGGPGPELGEMNHKVKLDKRFIIKSNRVDVPFDPGGFGSITKLEDEFFSKRGRMMQIILIFIFII